MRARRTPPLTSLATAVLAMALVAGACSNTHERPPVQFPPDAAPSRIVDSSGRLITTIAEENRRSVPLSEVPVTLQHAVVAIEDARFWNHDGVDPRAIARAAETNAEEGRVSEGGSTITQQYVKTALLDDDRTISRKVEEAALALALERAYSKEVILEHYLNTIYFGSGAYGVAAAAQEYFGVDVADVTLPQAALLAGIIQAPGRHDPRANPEGSRARRDLVLTRMRQQGYITPAQLESARGAELGVVAEGPPAELQRYPAAHFVEEVKRWLLTGSDALGDSQAERYNNLLRGGLTITTSIDLDVQARAEAAIAEILPGQGVDPRMPDAALTAVEPGTGLIRAMVGGRDFWGGHGYAKTNLAEGAGRQTGSTFKPIVMATALTNGVSTTERFDAPRAAVFPNPGSDPWRVRGGGIGSGNLAECTIVSSNTCYANIMLDDRVGPERSVEMGVRLGITSRPLAAFPSAVLGSNEVTVRDMASVFATFANAGVHVPPVYVTKIENSDGTVLYEHRHTQSKVLEPEVSRTVNSILPLVMAAPNGTGRSAAIDRPAGGKTGSTNNNTDAWFCGYTAQLSAAVWVGFAEPRPGSDGVARLVSMVRGTTPITVYGGTYPAQIWQRFMTTALEGQPARPLDPPNPPPPTTTLPPGQPDVLTPVTSPAEAGSVEVPDVRGETEENATSRLGLAGLDVRTVTVPAGSGSSPGRVVAQSPPRGASATRGSAVWLEVTAGHPASTTPVPDLRGRGSTEALAQLRRLGFDASSRPAPPPAGSLGPTGLPWAAGQVWRSIPAPGALVPDGRVVIEIVPLSATTPTTTTAAPAGPG